MDKKAVQRSDESTGDYCHLPTLYPITTPEPQPVKGAEHCKGSITYLTCTLEAFAIRQKILQQSN